MRFDVSETSFEKTYSFYGDLNENTSGMPKLNLSEKPIFLDFDQVHFINSSGVKTWMLWSKNYDSKIVQVIRLRPSFVRTSSIVNGFLPQMWQVLSFYVPYIGQDLTEEYVLFSKGKHFNDDELHIPPLISSLNTGQKLTLDVNPDVYLRFLKNRNPKFQIIKVE